MNPGLILAINPGLSEMAYMPWEIRLHPPSLPIFRIYNALLITS